MSFLLLPPRLRDAYAALPPVYWIVWLGTLVNKTGGVVIPFLTLYLTTVRGLPAARAGQFMAIYGLGTIIAGLCGGILADRVGRRATMLLSLFGGALAMLGIGLCRELVWLALSTFAMGWLAEMYRPAVAAFIADVVPVTERTRAYGAMYWVINLGFALAAMLGGLCAGYSYFLLFVLDAATMAAYGVIVLLWVPETRPKDAAAGHQQGGGIVDVLRDGRFMGFVVLMLGFALVMWQTGSAMPLDMASKKISPRVYGAVAAVNGVLIVVLQMRLTALLATRPRSVVMAGSAVVFGLGFGVFAGSAHWIGYALGTIVWTLGEIAHLPTSQTVVADLAPTHLRGRYQGMVGMSWGVASLIAPIAGGAILDGPGGRVLWLGCAGLMLLVGLGHLRLGRSWSAR